MKAKEFGARPPYNDFKSGQRYSANGYNKSFKKERFPKAQEYANRNLDEYHRFEETKDFTKEQDVRQSDAKQQSSQSKKTDNANKMRQRVLQQAVGIVVGSTVVVTSYQARLEEQAKQQDSEPNVAVVETVDVPAVTEEDILDETEDLEHVEDGETTVSDGNKIETNNSGKGGGSSSGRGGGSSGRGGRGGRNAGNTSDSSNDDAADSDVEDAELSEIEDTENTDETVEDLPDIQENTDEDQDVTDNDEQDTNTEDDENSESDNSETETPQTTETQEDKAPQHRSGTFSVWEWGSDYTSVSYVIKNDSGTVISSMPATLTSVVEPATCKEDGKITYTATIDVGGAEYTDTKVEILHALGHEFGNGEEVSNEGGQKTIRFECARCHEYFTIKTSINED